MAKKFNLIAVGGTFDLFHKGHVNLLKKAFLLSQKVVIGITSDKYILKNKEEGIARYENRKKAVKEYLRKNDLLGNSRIIKIDDKYAEAIINQDMDSIIVSKSTLKTAEIINKKRIDRKMKKLIIVMIEQFFAEDGLLISSKRIRDGQIDRSGKVYLNKEWLYKDLYLPKKLRFLLKKPFGEIIKKVSLINFKPNTATVGDVTTKKFNELYGDQKISIIDLSVARRKIFANVKELNFKNKREIIEVSNPPGMITSQLFKTIQKSLKVDSKKIILVEGEEDMAVLPLIILLPLNFQIYYGQPEKGLVKIVVDESVKKKAYQLLSKFDFKVKNATTRGY